MNNLKQLVEDFVVYTRTWSISEDEWYSNVDCVRSTNDLNNKTNHITEQEFERAIREDILYCFIYNRNSIKRQMEIDIWSGYESKMFDDASKKMEKEIRKIFKDFKLDRH